MRIRLFLLAALLTLLGSPASAGAQVRQISGEEGCALCHGDLELMRQYRPSVAEAASLVVSHATIQGSAHVDMACGECHSAASFERYPHQVTPVSTETCASCHEEQHDDFLLGIHSAPPEGGATAGSVAAAQGSQVAAECADCHNQHDIAWAEDTREGPGALAMNANCMSCHQEQRLPTWDPHGDTISCAGCHAPHEGPEVEAEASWMTPLNQYDACGACHEEVAEEWVNDVHRSAIVNGPGTHETDVERLEGEEEPPTCTTCHGAHGTRGPFDPEFAREGVYVCGECHSYYLETYAHTFHGKAAALGSEIAATCSQCHTAHAVYPKSDARSAVSDEKVLVTCQECHERARPAFVSYQSHEDPTDKERNPILFYSFWFMNFLLVGVLSVFFTHTALWWIRLLLDKRKGIIHGIGEGHGHGGGHG